MPEQMPEEAGCYTEHGVSGYGVAVKLTRDEPMDEAFVKAMGEEMMIAIARQCLDRGARCIGHIKSHFKTDAGTVKADTIGVAHGTFSAGSLSHPVQELLVAINSIVQGIAESTVKKATLDGIHETADRYGLSVVKEKEHAYFDAFDFVTSKQDYVRQLQAQLEPEEEGEKKERAGEAD